MGVQTQILKVTQTHTGTVAGGVEKPFNATSGTLALGVPGNIYDATPARIITAKIPETVTNAEIGGFVASLGVIVNTREHANVGTGEWTLAPSLKLSPNDSASFMSFGHVVVKRCLVHEILSAMNARVIAGEYKAEEDKEKVVTVQANASANPPVDEVSHEGYQAKDADGNYKDTGLVVVEMDGFKA